VSETTDPVSEPVDPVSETVDPVSETVDRLEAAAYTIPTDRPESDGTFAWDATTIVVVHVRAGDHWGLGYTYGPACTAELVVAMLRDVVVGADPMAPQRLSARIRSALRNAGQPGIGALALSAVDLAMHDLKARVLGLPLAVMLGSVRDAVPIYGSGGFTTYGPDAVAEQLAGWRDSGIDRMKIKVGRDPGQDPPRLAAAREAIGPRSGLMVDANGAFRPHEALAWAECYRDYGVDYLEEPVSSDDLAGLNAVRTGSPPGIAIAAGEYSWSVLDARRLLETGAVDIVQADATRCGGVTDLLRIDALCVAAGRPFSAHCAPAITASVGCALHSLEHLEYFHDHVRIEQLLFDGVPRQTGGSLTPALDTPGNGLSLRTADARRYQVWP